VQTVGSALGRLLNEVSWEGNARRYRHGGPGLENVLNTEVFQALDFLPRTEFLGRIIRSAVGGNPEILNAVAEQVEDLTFRLLPGDITLTEHQPNGKGRLNVQPDGILECADAYCMLEAKRIRRGAFMPEQLAREFLAVLQEAGPRRGLLLLVLPSPPPVNVDRHGRLALHDAVAKFLPQVLERAPGRFSAICELYSRIDSTLAYTTWQRIEEQVGIAVAQFSSNDQSVKRCVGRLGAAVINAIQWHGRQAHTKAKSTDGPDAGLL
jgi:hypothetical protein